MAKIFHFKISKILSSREQLLWRSKALKRVFYQMKKNVEAEIFPFQNMKNWKFKRTIIVVRQSSEDVFSSNVKNVEEEIYKIFKPEFETAVMKLEKYLVWPNLDFFQA